MRVARYVFVNLVAATVVVSAVVWSRPSASASPPSLPPPTVSQFDARWMGLVPNQPQGWEERNRRINSDFQQFNLRPANETELPQRCNGCAPWTVTLTANAPGKFDPTEAAHTGQPVTVNADNDGFFRVDQATSEATLTWPYADNAWATVHGRTSTTIDLDRMIELAHALQPDERTPIRLPMSLANVPAIMPLAEINIDKSEYGTTLSFGPCGRTAVGGAGQCTADTESLGVHIWPDDGYDGHFGEESAVPMKIGGKDGLYDDDRNDGGDHAAVQVQPGMLVVFDFGLPGPHYAGVPGQPEPSFSLKDVLAGVEWAPDPGNQATWRPVSDWAK